MKQRRGETEQQARSGWLGALALVALALGVVLAVFFTAALFTTATSRADGPPNLGTAFTLPFKLEQGRPAPARAFSVPRQGTPAPAATPGATPGPTPEPAAPSAPTGVNAYPISHTTIEVEWDEPQGSVDGFELQVSPDGSDGSWQLLAGKARLTDPGQRLYTWYQHSGLGGHQTRHYRVRAANGNAWSDWSASVSATTYSTSVPDLSVKARGKYSLEITWEMPSVSATVTGWTLEVTEDAPAPRFVTFSLPIGSPSGAYRVRPPRTQSNQQWTRLATPEAEDRSYTHSGLESGDTRFYRIRANTQVGTGSWSEGEDHATTVTDAIPAAPVLTARAYGTFDIDLSWTEPDGRGFPITGYEWQESPDGKAWGLSWSVSAAETYSIAGVDRPGTTRYYRVRAKTVKGLGPWSGIAKVTTENGGAGAPTNLVAVDVGATWVELKWQAPAQVGAGITGYQVQRRDPTSIKELWINVGATDASKLTFRDTGLVSAEGYLHRVAARDSGGLGPWTNPYSDVTTEPLPPAAPKLTARAMTRDGGPGRTGDQLHRWIELTWIKPTTVYGLPQEINYDLVRSANGKDGWDEVVYYGTKNKYRDYEVSPGETWHYRVRAAIDPLDYGYGPWSTVVSATVRAALPSSLPFLTADAAKEDRIEVRWKPPEYDGGSPVTGYEIQVSTEGYRDLSKYKTVSTPSASARTYSHRGLLPDTEYCYRYRAKNSEGWSLWQEGNFHHQCFHTGPVLPATPSMTVAASGTTGVQVSWTQASKPGVTVTDFSVGISHDGVAWVGVGTPGADDRSLTISYADIRISFPTIEELAKVYIRVRARSENGGSDWSQARSIAIPEE